LYPVIRILPFIPALGLLLALGILSCSRSGDAGEGGIEVPAENDASDPELVVKRRGDGTISSVNQVNELGQVDGTRVTYFPDGKTVYSKLSFRNGIKHGLAVTYYNNGQVFEMATFENGEKHGPQRKFYKTGELLAEYDYEYGHALPGLKEYTQEGALIKEYPEVQFREIDHLAARSRIDLEISCTWKKGKMKYFVLQKEEGKISRIYLITENGSTTMQFYLPPGEALDKQVDILAEIPTDLGNILVLERSYQLSVVHKP
jgi:hypothetical protein